MKKDNIHHIKSRPYLPMTLGKIERFWKTIYLEFLTRAQFESFEDAAERIRQWAKYYNHKRPHRREEAMEILTELQNSSRSKPIRAINFAKIYGGLGQLDKTFEWLEKAYRERNMPLIFIKNDETMENIRSDPRFSELLSRMGLG